MTAAPRLRHPLSGASGRHGLVGRLFPLYVRTARIPTMIRVNVQHVDCREGRADLLMSAAQSVIQQLAV